MSSYSEAATLAEQVTLVYTTHDIKRLYRLADLTTQTAAAIVDSLDDVDYLLPATLLVLSEAEMRFEEIRERLNEAMARAMYIQGLDDGEESEGEGS